MIDLALLETLFDRTKGRVKYKLGAKANLLADSADIHQIDCSGFSRWILARASEQEIRLPDGSQVQLDWCRTVGYHRLTNYSDVQYAKEDPSRLFIAFLSPKPGKAWPRHTWLIQAGKTLESCSSLGVGSRAWDTPVLKPSKNCFELPVG